MGLQWALTRLRAVVIKGGKCVCGQYIVEKKSVCPLGTNAANTVAFNVTYFCPSREIPVLLNVGHFWNQSSRFATRKGLRLQLR